MYKERTEDEALADIKVILDKVKLKYTTEFVPYSQSRSYKKDEFVRNKNLNWKVGFYLPSGYGFQTDYSQGQGHIPNYNRKIWRTSNGRFNLIAEQAINQIVETGYYSSTSSFCNSKGAPIPHPKMYDVLGCLLSDADVLNYPCFEDWAENYGYEVDSRKAEKIYKDCLELGLKMRVMFGEPTLSQLQELFRDAGY